MHFAFADLSGLDYTIHTPRERALGGTQSALLYLAIELAKRGHKVECFHQGQQRSTDLGVTVEKLPKDPRRFATVDVFTSINGTRDFRVNSFSKLVPERAVRLQWPTVATDQAPVVGLADEKLRAYWDGFVMLSEWASQAYQKVFHVDVDKCVVLKNAVAPPFEDLFKSGSSVLAHKKPHTLVYTSAPFRGLAVLLEAWPAIRAAYPDATVQVFSGMGTYQIEAEKDAFTQLYERCRTTPGVDYRGPVPQPELAAALRQAAVLAYPCIFDETSCISVMEAMAAGCAVVTTQRGALPETTGGFARLVPSPEKWRPLVAPFAAATIKTLRELDEAPLQMEAHLQAQVAWMRATGTWAERARDWESAMLRLVALKRGAA